MNTSWGTKLDIASPHGCPETDQHAFNDYNRGHYKSGDVLTSYCGEFQIHIGTVEGRRWMYGEIAHYAPRCELCERAVIMHELAE